jgi:hypothetical protein
VLALQAMAAVHCMQNAEKEQAQAVTVLTGAHWSELDPKFGALLSSVSECSECHHTLVRQHFSARTCSVPEAHLRDAVATELQRQLRNDSSLPEVTRYREVYDRDFKGGQGDGVEIVGQLLHMNDPIKDAICKAWAVKYGVDGGGAAGGGGTQAQARARSVR